VTAEPCCRRATEKPAQSSAACVLGAMAPSRARSCPPPMVLVLLLAAKSSGYLHQDEAQEEVTAVAGGEVSLPCGAADNPFPGLAVGDEPCLLLWFREGSATPILSADARRGGGLHNAKVSHPPGLPRSVRSGPDVHLETFGKSGLDGR
ncbi:hypothetical protein HPB47_026164, partial [Ixodes persulcatus]